MTQAQRVRLGIQLGDLVKVESASVGDPRPRQILGISRSGGIGHMPRTVDWDRGRLRDAQYGLSEFGSKVHTCGSCLNSEGERRSGTFADKLLVDMIPLLDLVAELSGRAAVNITSGGYV